MKNQTVGQGLLIIAIFSEVPRSLGVNIYTDKKSTVWRCVSRVLKKDMDFDCPARTVKEEVLQGAVVTAVNDA